MEDEQSTSPSLKCKLKQTLCLSCCFSNNRGREILDADDCPRLPEIKKKCRNLINRMIASHHHRCSPADFKYDLLSYALNFDDGELNDEEYRSKVAPLRNFYARIPVSPPLKTVTKV